MAENNDLIGETPKSIFRNDQEQVTDNGDGQPYERHDISSMNGKRALDGYLLSKSEFIQEYPTNKKPRTIQNGVLAHSQLSSRSNQSSPAPTSQLQVLSPGQSAQSPQNTKSLRNGELDDKTSPHSNTNSSLLNKSLSEMSNGDGIGAKIKVEADISVTNSEPKPNMYNERRADLSLITKEEVKVKHELCDSKSIKKENQENVRSNTAVAAPGKEPEIITLSDSEDEFQEVLNQAMSFNSSDKAKNRLLKTYKDQLRAEETRLILLRKLKLSLVNIEKQGSNSIDLSTKPMDMRNQSLASSSHRSSGGGNAPPPLKRGQHQMQSSSHSVINSHSSSPHHKALSNPHTPHSSDRLKMGHHSNGPSSGGPPPLVNMAKSSSHSSANNSAAYSSYQNPTVSQPKKPAAPPPPPQLTPEQKLSAARVTLKKQLEQALQQVAPPKPPPPEVNFLPSLASGEFVYLIGMEEVVKQLLSTDQKDVKFVFNPFSCVQCGTDFTPVWKRDKPGSKNVICEKCITSNQKRVLKQEHTAKLKSVFTKALQKEQEIERRIAAGSPLSDMPGLAATASRQQQQQSSTHSTGSSSSSAANTPSMPQLTPQHTQSASPNSQQGLTAPQLQHQALLHAAQAEQMRAMLAAQMLPYQLYGVTTKQAADLQRQYLLDMINQNRTWKT